MDEKLLSKLIAGEEGTIVMIRGKADTHRYLLKMGLTIGSTVTIENTGMDMVYSPLAIRVGDDTFYLDREIASGINVAVN